MQAASLFDASVYDRTAANICIIHIGYCKKLWVPAERALMSSIVYK